MSKEVSIFTGTPLEPPVATRCTASFFCAYSERNGITSKSELDRLADGTAEVKLRVPAHLRAVMCEIGLHEALVPISVMTLFEDDVVLAAVADGVWSDLEFEVALDSGAVIHVCSPSDCPGYMLEESQAAGGNRSSRWVMAGPYPTWVRSR